MSLITNKSYVDKDVMFYGRNTYDTTTTPSNQVKIVASDAAADDYFGQSVAAGSNRIVVGADGDDDAGAMSGSAYIFNLSGTQLKKITASDASADAGFGFSVAIGSGRIVVGAYSEDRGGSFSLGSAYIFDLNGTQIAKIISSTPAQNDNFAYAVAVGCGRVVAGSQDVSTSPASSGSIEIFDLNGNRIAKIKASDAAASDYFGRSVSVGSGRIVVGAYLDDDLGSNSGSAYILDLNGNQLAKIKASDGAADDQFGASIAVESGRIVVGAPFDDDNGTSSGAAYIFDLNGTQLAKIKASDAAAGDQFGISVAIGSGRIVVGAIGDDSSRGSAYVFDLDGTQRAKITASDGANFNYFGKSVGVASGRIVSGAYYHNSSRGAAYIYTTPNQPHILDILDNN